MEKIDKDCKYLKNDINLVFRASNVAPSIFRAYFAFHRKAYTRISARSPLLRFAFLISFIFHRQLLS